MDRIFNGANSFNQTIGKWQTSKVTNMYCAFAFTDDFAQDLTWDVSRVTDMFGMFAYSGFNSPSIIPSNQPSSSFVPTKLPSGAPSKAPPKKPNNPSVFQTCVSNAFTKRTWCCQKRLECKQAIKTACRPVFVKAGKTAEFLNRLTNAVVRIRCIPD